MAHSVIFLNPGTLSRTWPQVLAAQKKYEDDFEQDPSSALFSTWGRLWKVQEKVASFFKARPEDIFLRMNVTQALNEFILGFHLDEGEMAFTDQEYGAIVNICRLRAERDRRNLCVIKLGDALKAESEDAVVEIIARQLKPKTRLLLVSHVMTGTGLRIPIAKLAHLTREKNIVLVVDGAHGPGAVPLDFSELEDVDFYAGNLHKWMRGPKGTAFGWIPKRNRSSLTPVSGGWTTFETPPAFVDFGGGDRFAVKQLMSYCLNFAPFFALDDLIDVWDQQTPQVIFSQLDLRRESIVTQMQNQLGLSPLSTSAKLLRSPLVTFPLSDQLAAKGLSLRSELVEIAGVSTSITQVEGRCCLRLSSHLDNSIADISEGVRRLSKVLL